MGIYLSPENTLKPLRGPRSLSLLEAATAKAQLSTTSPVTSTMMCWSGQLVHSYKENISVRNRLTPKETHERRTELKKVDDSIGNGQGHSPGATRAQPPSLFTTPLLPRKHLSRTGSPPRVLTTGITHFSTTEEFLSPWRELRNPSKVLSNHTGPGIVPRSTHVWGLQFVKGLPTSLHCHLGMSRESLL